MGKIDLHLHSSFSDGLFSPEKVVLLAKHNNLKAISLTDHDTIAGLPEAFKFGQTYGLEIVPGVEISCHYSEREIHLLGYFFYIPGKLENILQQLKNNRIQRAHHMLEKLNKLKIPITEKELSNEAGKAAAGRLHLARLLVKKGHVSSLEDAFNFYLNQGKPAYVPRLKLEYQDAIKLLREAGAIIFLAHPGITSEEINSIRCLKDCGIDGLEVYHPRHAFEESVKYLKIAQEENLLIGGGTDFHGDDQLYPGYIAMEYRYLQQIKKKKLEVPLPFN